jgi:hypothetical protein
MVTGESVPLSPDMISIEIGGDDAGLYEEEFVQHAASAVFHYFKHDLGRHSVTVGEFAGAMEKVLGNLGFNQPSAAPDAPASPVLESDLARLVGESGIGLELFFFNRLRDEVHRLLQQAPRELRFRGLRPCAKQLAGARRWSGRCQSVRDRIVEFIRDCLGAEPRPGDCDIFVE